MKRVDIITSKNILFILLFIALIYFIYVYVNGKILREKEREKEGFTPGINKLMNSTIYRPYRNTKIKIQKTVDGIKRKIKKRMRF